MSRLATRKPSGVPPTSAFENVQLNLFQSFLCNTEDERDQLSNTIDLWDSIPRYSVSRLAMTKLRSPEGTLKLLKLDFHYRGTRLKAIIQPARLEEDNGETIDYYPSASEELVEDALRKIAADQQQGFFDKVSYRSGVVFTLYMLREELRRQGHSRSYQQIMQSLQILSRSTIEIRVSDDDTTRFAVSAYFPMLVGVTRKHLDADPHAKWIVQFHPLMTQSIDKLTYRQFNYHQMMGHSTQLARWLHKQLALKFTFASIMHSFEVRYRTIRRDSALLNGYILPRKAIKAVDDALEELRAQKVLMAVQKREVRVARGKLEDVVYLLTASLEFIKAMKAANKRRSEALGALGDIPPLGIAIGNPLQPKTEREL
jgi:hypothetical protein